MLDDVTNEIDDVKIIYFNSETVLNTGDIITLDNKYIKVTYVLKSLDPRDNFIIKDSISNSFLSGCRYILDMCYDKEIDKFKIEIGKIIEIDYENNNIICNTLDEFTLDMFFMKFKNKLSDIKRLVRSM